MRDLGVLPGGKNSTALAVNARGQVIGSGDRKGGSGRAFFWQDGSMTDLGVLAGGTQSKAVALNDQGQVIAYSWFTKYDPNGEDHYNAKGRSSGGSWGIGRANDTLSYGSTGR
jgi:probable HAF family extracellular repeat protein